MGIVVLLILVVLVGGSQLPKLARNLGLAGKEFRKAHDEAMSDTPSVATPPVAPPVTQFAVAPTPVAPAAAPVVKDDDRVTLSRADLEALLKERDARVQPDANS